MQESKETTEQIDWPAKHPSQAGSLRLGISEVLRSLRHYLRAQFKAEDIDHTIDRLEERGRRKRKRSTIFLERTRKGPSSIRPTSELFRFKGNIGEAPERRCGAHMGFPERGDTILN